MKNEAEIKELLIQNAIRLIAEGGFEKATTKELTHSGGTLPGVKMNEVYIYRFFGSKDKLYEAAFVTLDEELYQAFRSGVQSIGGFEGDVKEKLYAFFEKAWSFLMRNEERCRCYVRYYYSIYFNGSSSIAHHTLFSAIVSDMTPLFRKDANASAILHSVFTTLLNFSIRVYNGELADNEMNRPHIFNILYCIMMTYFENSAPQEREALQILREAPNE